MGFTNTEMPPLHFSVTNRGIEEEPESAPLIVQYADIENGDEVSNTGNNGSLLNPILNLTCTIIGSGIIALPKSFQVLGVVLGCTIMVGVACLSYLSLAGLIRWVVFLL